MSENISWCGSCLKWLKWLKILVDVVVVYDWND
jgi:hypothetical protein